MINHKLFYCHFKLFDRSLQDLNVFVWDRSRIVRERVKEYIKKNYEELLSTLGVEGDGGWEVAFSAVARDSSWGSEGEVSNITLRQWKALPSETLK